MIAIKLKKCKLSSDNVPIFQNLVYLHFCISFNIKQKSNTHILHLLRRITRFKSVNFNQKHQSALNIYIYIYV